MIKTARERFAKNLASIRHARKMTQSELAIAMGIHIQTVKVWESGRRIPDSKLIDPLADTLKCDVSSFFAATSE